MGIKDNLKRLNEKKFSLGDIINCIIWMTICMIPLVIDFTKPQDPFSGPKFEFLITMGVIILILMIVDKGIRLNKVTKIYLMFLTLTIISTIFAFDRYQAIRGYWEWWEGLIAFFMYGIMLVAASNYLKLNKTILKVFIGFGLLVSIITIAQGFNISLFGKTPYVSLGETRATIGNRNFVSSYLIIFLGITVSSFIFKGKKSMLAIISIFYIALITTQTRGGWVTLVAICVLITMCVYGDKIKLKRMGILIGLLLVLFSGYDIINSGKFTDRLGTIKEDVTNFSDKSGSGRIAIYKAVGMVIREHPILGIGPDNLWFGVDIYAPEREEFFWQEQRLALSKAHNELLHIASTLGIPAMCIYISMMFKLLKDLWNNKEDDNFKVVIITISGYLIQANLNISVIDVATIFWVIVGLGSNTDIIKRYSELEVKS